MLKFITGEIVKRNVTGDIGTLYRRSSVEEQPMRFLKAGMGTFHPETLPIVKREDVSETTLNEKVTGYLIMEFRMGEVIDATIINNGEYIILKAILGGKKTPSYHVYLNFKDICRGYESFDSALIGLLEYKHLGNNSQAGLMFERMLQMPKRED